MNVDLTSFSFGSTLQNGTGTPSWGTSLGQIKPDYKFTYSGSEEIVVGMAYCAVNLEYVFLPLGKGNSIPKKSSTYLETKISSLFKKVYVNGLYIGQPFVMVLISENSDSHNGRHSIKYSEKNFYDDGKNRYSNSEFVNKVQAKFGLASDSCWFVYEIRIINQDELHLSAIFVDKSNSKVYSNSQERKEEWEDLIEKTTGKKYLGLSSSVGSTKSVQSITSTSPNHLTALRTKPFLLLAGISGTGKSRIVRKLAQATVTKELQEYDGADFDKDRWNLHRPANFELIQVKPNWHNSMDVVGYLSNIPTPHYVFTPFVEFIVKAWMNPDVPFFLCLDEMNLAPVEEYFAEFLSAIESRAFEDDKYVTDPIIKPFNSFGEGMGDSMINTLNASLKTPIADELKTQLVEKGLSLPRNLIVVGTVNMDETTYSFSRKVLDRAMSIEMNDVDYDNFLADSTDEELKSMLSKFNNINDLLVNRHIEAKEVVGSLGKAAETVIGYLKKVNTLLEGTPFKLGYRAANEALIYVAAAKDFGFYDVEAALDQFTLMKILSRLEGDSSKMKVEDNDKRLSLLDYSASDVKDKRAESPDKETITLLTCMHKIIEDFLLPKPKSLEETVTVTDLANPDEGDDKESDDKKKLKSLEKLENMIAQLHRERFVSYWN